MPTKLGTPYSPLWRGRYPHMLVEDIPVWDKYLDRHASEFQRVFYDVRVGGVIASTELAIQKDIDMFYDVTAKRIDALAELDKELWLVEVSSHPGLRATGQLMTYLALWFDDPVILKPIFGVLVAQNIDADLQRALTIYGMRFRLVN